MFRHFDSLQDNVAAALAMRIACEMDPSSQHHKHDIERLMRRIPQAVADVLEVQHACSLICVRPKFVTTYTLQTHCTMRNTVGQHSSRW